MKQLLLLLVVFYSTITQAKNYYISTTGNDANDGLTPATAWQSIKKVNGFTFTANDHILFKRGEIFNGAIKVNRSNLFFNAYGSGSNPLISGLLTVSSWTNVGGNIWESNVLGAKAGVDIVTVNGEQKAPGRYPNTGYLTYQSSTSTSYTASALSGSPSFIGGEVVARKERWIMDRQSITAHSGTTLTVPTSTSGFGGKNNAGLFIQKHINTLDIQGEWVFSSSTGKLKMFSTSTPGTTKICTIDTLFYIENYSNINIDSLSFEGGGYVTILVNNSNTVNIRNCIIRNAGQYGIKIDNTPGITIDNNQIYDVLGTALAVSNAGVTGVTVINNIINRTGWIPGLGWKSGGGSDNSYSGLSISGNGTTIQYNTIDSIGFKGINFNGNNVLVANNLVSNFCMVKDDGGGIYTWSNDGNTIYTNRVVRDNIILNSIGAPTGTASTGTESHGIYMDGAAMNVDITGNSIINGSPDDAGIFFNNTSNIKVKGNTLYNVAVGIRLNRLPADVNLIRSMTITGNVVYADTSNLFYWNGSLNVPVTIGIQQDMRNMFTKIDSNYYRNNIVAPFDWFYHLYQGGTFVDPLPNDLTSWQKYIAGDMNSHIISNNTPRFEYNATSNNKTLTLDGKYLGVDSTIYNGTIILKPYSSAILFYSGPIDLPAFKVDAGSDISLISPMNTTLLKGSANENVIGYRWTKISGPDQFTIITPNSASTTINNLTTGKYTFQLKAFNTSGDSAIATVNVVTLGVLPVTLTDFTAINNNEKIALQWKVASEINVSHYTIQRSGNGQSFENIGEVTANNLFTVQGNYNFDDPFPLQDINYYRLEITDNDGTIKYSKTISITTNNISSFKMSQLSVSTKNNNLKIGVHSNYQQQMQVVLVDVNGRILYANAIQLQKGFNTIDKKLPTLNIGVYYAKLFTGNQVMTRAFLTEH